MYSEFGGVDFLRAYKKSREDYISSSEIDDINIHCTRQDLYRILEMIKSGKKSEYRELLDLYIKRFEVSKRIYDEYNMNWRKTDNSSYDRTDLYIMLAECCAYAYRENGCTKYLSCLLKIDDTLLSLRDRLIGSEKKKLKEILELECEYIESLSGKKGVDIS
jgi:hypothetical protein